MLKSIVSMASGTYKAPPALSKSASYNSWLEKVKIWQCFTDSSKSRQAPAIFLILEGKAREAILELKVDKLSRDSEEQN